MHQTLCPWLEQRNEPLNTRGQLVLIRRFGLDGQMPQILGAPIAPLGVTVRESIHQY